MLSPVLRSACSLQRSPIGCVWAAFLLCFGCAKVAGFDDFTGPSAGGNRGNDTNTGGAGFVLTGGATGELGGTGPVYLTLGGSTAAGGTSSTGIGGSRAGGASTGGTAAGGAATGGAATGGSGTGGASVACGALNQQCCDGDTCTAPNATCNTVSNICEACGANQQRCCNAEARCTTGCCVSNRCVAVNQSCGSMNNQCQRANYCANCGREGLPCCGQTNGSCDYGLACTANTCEML